MIKIKDRVLDECIPLSPPLAAMLACQDLALHPEDESPIVAAKNKAICDAFAAGLASNKLVLHGGLDTSATGRLLHFFEDLDDECTVENAYRDARRVGAQQTATPWLALDEGARKHLFNECNQLARRIRALKRAAEPMYVELDGDHPLMGQLVPTSVSHEELVYDKEALAYWPVSQLSHLAPEEHADD